MLEEYAVQSEGLTAEVKDLSALQYCDGKHLLSLGGNISVCRLSASVPL